MDCQEARFLLLYGSQTGQAQAIAEEFRDRALSLGLKPDFQCMKGTESRYSLEREKLAVIVISTTGDGEAPDTARKLIRRLNKRTLVKDYLKNLSYTLLALGDSNYLNFANCGKLFDKRLRELGAKPFQDLCCADDAVGLEVAVEPWIEETLIFLLNHFQLHTNIPPKSSLENMSHNIEPDPSATLLCSNSFKDIQLNLPLLPQRYISLNYQETVKDLIGDDFQNNLSFPTAVSNTFSASVINAEILTESPAVKEYIQITFKIPDDDVKYQPGDAFGIVPKNDFVEVESILKHLNILDKADLVCLLSSTDSKHNIPAHLPSKSTLRRIFTSCCDIRSPPKKTLLRTLAEYATDDQEKQRLLELCSRQGNCEFIKLIRSRNISILDLLTAFPSCSLTPVEAFLETLPRLQPRYYSVANSPLVDASVFSIVFSIVNFNEGFGKAKSHSGVCTGFLRTIAKTPIKGSDTMKEQDLDSLSSSITAMMINELETVKMFKRKTSNFVLPEEQSLPLIMIGPGTGVAPFVGFLKHRKKLVENNNDGTNFGQTWLYYGCRHKEHDFLFEKELNYLHSEGVLTQLRLSFSRDAESSVRYVQDNIKEDFASLLHLIELEEAIVYVCGDAKNMAKDVANTFIECYQSLRSISIKEATLWHTDLQKSKRYIQDLWL